ncbi:MAG: RNA polymerase factor sigma-54 [Peptococcaceae bacterium]|nr:RNA polymerase factor sigma-54 [Peptococcaceae bacterium]
MANNFGLLIEQNNKQIISPQMVQAIEIMQLSLPELNDYINNELIENPLIEVVEEYETGSNGDEYEPDEASFPQEYENDWLQGIVKDVLRDDKDSWMMPSEPSRTEGVAVEGSWLDNSSLQEYLMEQLRFIKHGSKLSEKEYEAAEYIIGNIDPNGYLVITIEEISETLKISQNVAQKALSIVQQLDPPGVGARNLVECLRLQLYTIPDCPPDLERMLDHLDDLAAGFLKKISVALDISVNEVRVMAELLKLLDPKPGSRFDTTSQTKYIIPDAVIRKIGDEYYVLVNESDIPKISINERYKKALQELDDQTMKRFVKEKVSSAVNLLKSIEHRRATIYNVLEAVVQKQKDFLEYGFHALKPLTMKEIAEELHLHESTVSRVASNKYVQTPRGLFSIKCFFAGSIGGEKEITPETIKNDLRKFISSENPLKPYSDQDLAEMFQKKGISIARRTIAKYREELRIPSSSLRRKEC